MRELIRQICEAPEEVIVRGAISPDPDHRLLSVLPDLAPAKVLQYIKGRSSRLPQVQSPALGKRYRGQHLWAQEYFCEALREVDGATIKEYIESRKWDADQEGFKITACTDNMGRESELKTQSGHGRNLRHSRSIQNPVDAVESRFREKKLRE